MKLQQVPVADVFGIMPKYISKINNKTIFPKIQSRYNSSENRIEDLLNRSMKGCSDNNIQQGLYYKTAWPAAVKLIVLKGVIHTFAKNAAPWFSRKASANTIQKQKATR